VAKRRSKTGYEKHKAQARARRRQETVEGQEIGPIPPVREPRRRAAAMGDFPTFCKEYLGETFRLPWSRNHTKATPHIVRVVTNGGRFCVAMGRGEGKSSLAEAAGLWVMLPGRERFITLIGSNATKREELMTSIKTSLETNDALLEDFPEVVHPIRVLEREPNKCRGQKLNGKSTRIVWSSHKIIFPTVPGSRASGGILTVTGIEGGGLTGQKHKLSSGETIRPGLLIIDDPQDPSMAWSDAECNKRRKIILSAVMGAGGAGKKLGAIMCCTVIREGDVSSQFLELWPSERLPMIYEFGPAAEKEWLEYAEVLGRELKAGGDGSVAGAFYEERRETMDARFVVSWPEYTEGNEISGIQHAMNKRFENEEVFWAEFQQRPQVDEDIAESLVSAEDICKRTNGLKQGVVPTNAEILTAQIDVHDRLLFYTVVAWKPDFTGWVLDYGTYPDQKARRFTMRRASLTLRRKHQGVGVEEAIRLGLEALTQDLSGRVWKRQDGAAMRINHGGIDAGYKPRIVELVCRRQGEPWMPYLGRGITSKTRPIHAYKRRPGRRLGHYWWIPAANESDQDRHVIADVNYWKSFVHARLDVGLADAGSLTLWGKKPQRHRLFAAHLTAEVPTLVEGPYATVEEWDPLPAKPDNHWFDCLVGCAVGASMEGASLPGSESRPARRRKRRKWTQADLRRRA